MLASALTNLPSDPANSNPASGAPRALQSPNRHGQTRAGARTPVAWSAGTSVRRIPDPAPRTRWRARPAPVGGPHPACCRGVYLSNRRCRSSPPCPCRRVQAPWIGLPAVAATRCPRRREQKLGSCTNRKGKAPCPHSCRQSSISERNSRRYRSASRLLALFSPWYQITPRIGYGVRGAIIALNSHDGVADGFRVRGRGGLRGASSPAASASAARLSQSAKAAS